MANNGKPLLQFTPKDGSLWFNNHVETLTADELAEIKTTIGDYWWTDNDELAFVTIYTDMTLYCERKKKAWNYRTGSSTFTGYEFTAPTKEQTQTLYNQLSNKFETLRIEKLKAEKDKISGILTEEYSGLISSFKGMRTRMLLDSDYTQLADSPFSADDKALWATYRQYLRDMPADPAWLSNDVFKVDFPITPTDYLTLDPSRGTTYLSIPAHFQNAAALKAKVKLLRVNRYLNLPQLYISDADWETKTYDELNERLNKYLAKIDGDLKFDISFTTKDGNRTSAHGTQTGQHTQS